MYSIQWALGLAVAVFFGTIVRAEDFRDLLEKRTYSGDATKLHYRLLKPATIEKGKAYPLVVFLHGAGERGDDNDKQLVHGVAEFAKSENRSKYPCFLIAPQCPTGKSWAPFSRKAKPATTDDKSSPLSLTIDLVAALQKEFPIEPKRIYITGLSMGGYGTWAALARRPDLFAAGVPICGGGDEKWAERIAKIPVWVFHGALDRVVPPERSRVMVEALKKAGAEPKYTEYPKENHASWVPAYKDAEMFAWLFAQKK